MAKNKSEKVFEDYLCGSATCGDKVTAHDVTMDSTSGSTILICVECGEEVRSMQTYDEREANRLYWSEERLGAMVDQIVGDAELEAEAEGTTLEEIKTSEGTGETMQSVEGNELTSTEDKSR